MTVRRDPRYVQSVSTKPRCVYCGRAVALNNGVCIGCANIGPTQKIIAAAIRYKGKIYIGSRHSNIIEYIGEVLHERAGSDFANQGFVTTTGEYVSRERAAEIAYKAGQISNPLKQLHSEDCIKYYNGVSCIDNTVVQ